MSETKVYLDYSKTEPTMVNETTYRNAENYLMRDRLYSDGSWNRVVVAWPDDSVLICHPSEYRIPGPHPEPFLLT